MFRAGGGIGAELAIDDLSLSSNDGDANDGDANADNAWYDEFLMEVGRRVGGGGGIAFGVPGAS